MSHFRDKVVIVTGGGSGLGRALCEEMGRRGAITVVTDINRQAAESVADAIVAAGGRSRAVELDVTQPGAVTEVVDQAVSAHGRLDFMFNNAGVIVLSEVRDMSLELWHRIIGVNLLGVLHGANAAYVHMVRQGSGHIVNIASLAGLVHMPTYAAYSSTKHAVVGFSTSMRPEAARLGVKISVVCPGPLDTGLGASATIVNADRKRLEGQSRNKPGMNADQAAQAILRGVERNQRVIVFPFSARLIWWVHRIQPAWLAPLESWFVNTLHAARTEG